jgi:hypothetical protein
LLDVDPDQVDPRRILAEIATDTSAPAAARVAACRVLLASPKTSGPEKMLDQTSARAITLLQQGRLH